MKVTIIKGPLFEQQREKAYELLYRIISKKVSEEMRGTNESTISKNQKENA